MATDTAATRSARKLILSGLAIVAVAAGAFIAGRSYPPSGPTAGAITPANRHVDAGAGAGAMTPGDAGVPQLMQTDAYVALMQNRAFRALASDPGFQALAMTPEALAAMVADPQGFKPLAANPPVFQAASQAAHALAADQREARGQQASGTQQAEPGPNVRALDPAAAGVLATHRPAVVAMAGHPAAFQSLAENSQALAAFTRNARALRALAADGSAQAHFQTLLVSPSFQAMLQSQQFEEFVNAR